MGRDAERAEEGIWFCRNLWVPVNRILMSSLQTLDFDTRLALPMGRDVMFSRYKQTREGPPAVSSAPLS